MKHQPFSAPRCRRWSALWLAIATLALAGHAPAVLAHGGGTPQLVKAPAGDYALYVWTNPNPAGVGALHVTVALVQPESDAPVLNAAVQVTATPENGDPIAAAATHEEATIKSYYEVDLELPRAGLWQIDVSWQDGGASGQAGFPLQVEPAPVNTQLAGLGVALLAVVGVVAWLALRRRRAAASGQ